MPNGPDRSNSLREKGGRGYIYGPYRPVFDVCFGVYSWFPPFCSGKRFQGVPMRRLIRGCHIMTFLGMESRMIIHGIVGRFNALNSYRKFRVTPKIFSTIIGLTQKFSLFPQVQELWNVIRPGIYWTICKENWYLSADRGRWERRTTPFFSHI